MIVTAFVFAVGLYLVTISVFTCGQLWRRWFVVLGSIVPGSATVALASTSSSLWLPAFAPLGGFDSLEGVLALAALIVVSWFFAALVFTRDGVDVWLIQMRERMGLLFRSRTAGKEKSWLRRPRAST